MPDRRWAERVEDELARRGVPARFRPRLLAELRDHADDLMDEGGFVMTENVLNARLGGPAALAGRAAEEYRRARWTSRHPLLVFGLLPLPTTLLFLTALLLLVGLGSQAAIAAFGCDPDHLPRSTLLALVYSFLWATRLVPFMLAAVVFTRLYLRSRVNRLWFAAAAVQVLGTAGTFISSLKVSEVPGQSMWMMGFAWVPAPFQDGWALPYLNLSGWPQLVQVVVPLLIAGLTVWSARRKEAALVG